MKSTLVCILLFFILLAILFFSFNSSLKELMSQADKDKMKADMGKSEDEIAKKSGTSEAQEMENLKKKYTGDTAGAVYVPLPTYAPEPNINIKFNADQTFENKRKALLHKYMAQQKIWDEINSYK